MNKETNLSIDKIFNLAFKDHTEGKFKSAENSYNKILIKDPNHFNTLYLLGTLNFQKQKFGEAKKNFEKAILIKPNHAELCNNFGATLIQMGDYTDSIKYLKNAINILPKYAEAYNNLGSVFKELKDYVKSIPLFEKAIQIQPNFIDPYINLGIVFKELGDFTKAIILFQTAIKIHPQNIKAHQNLMESYENLNHEKELKQAILNAKKLINDDPIIRLYESIILYNSNKFLEAKNILEKTSFSVKDIKNESKRFLILANCYDRIGDNEKAYNYFVEANNLFLNLRKVNLFDKNRYIKVVKDRVNFFTKPNIKKWNNLKLSNPKRDPIFLVGFPRSGTTLLDTILRSHPLIEVVEEKPIINKLVDLLNKLSNRGLENLETINEAQVEKLRKIYFDTFDSQIKNKNNSKIYIDKLPLNIVHAGEIVRIFPNAKFIVLLRHPYDCVFSCFMQNFELNDAMANFLNLKDAARLYDYVMSLWIQYLSIFKINYCEVKYENIIKDFKPTVSSVLKFLNLSWNNSVVGYSTTAKERDNISTPSYNQVTKPLYSHASGRWKRYDNQMSNIDPFLKKWLEKYNY
jgi:tetratricopeptide (TPR) repeat protein